VIALPIQGNVDTRLKKLDNGDFDAIVLARAGLMRLDLGVRISSVLEVSSWYHAVGQGALAIEIREQDDAAAQAVLALDHALTRAQTDAERSFLGGLGGGCLVPVGVRGSVAGERLDICGMVCGWGGEPFLEEASTGHPREAKDIGLRLAEKLLKKGAAEVLKSVRERQAGL
jgi:hydroxymethylbilane synthase